RSTPLSVTWTPLRAATHPRYWVHRLNDHSGTPRHLFAVHAITLIAYPSRIATTLQVRYKIGTV
ncbi:MAG: hypothetical protein KFF50_12125, partial [Desulfatitalea sp.]|nr:hypothetical protein [Desulfatitalea sp.]